MFKRLYEKLTGTPWTTTVSCTAQFGPTIAARYPELAALSDEELMAFTPETAIAYAMGRRYLLAYLAKHEPANASRSPVGV